MSNRRRKLIAYESDEETEDSNLNLSIPTDFLHPSSSVGPSHGKDTLEYPRLLTTLHSPVLELVGNRGGPASGFGENHSSERAGVLKEVGEGDESSTEPSRPSRRRNLGHRMEADAYPINYITCATTQTGLFKLRNLYNIPEEVLLVIPGKGDVLSRPPREYVTMHVESFKLGAWLPLQPYFARILGGMHLVPGQLHPNGWRVLSVMYVLWERCELEEPSLAEVKHLYQLRSSPREAESRGLINNLNDKPLLQVETALVNVSTCQDLLPSTNLVGSCLVDVVVGMDNKVLNAMTRKSGQDLGSSSNPPSPPKKAIVGLSKAHVPAVPPPPPRKSGGEKTSDKSPEVSIHSRDRSTPLPPRDQGDYLTPYQRDYGKSVEPKMVKDIESMNLSELAGSVQRVSFKLATLVSCYKNRSTCHERRLQADNQNLKKKVESADRSKEKLVELNKQITDLEEKVAVAESTSSKLKGELGDLKSDLQATQSERDTLKTALEGEIKSLSEQLAEAKGKSVDVDDRLDAEYDSGVTFCYKRIMSVLKEKYPELDMSKLEAGVQRYMAEANQVEAPLRGVQAEEAGDRAPEVGQGSVPPPPDVADPPLPVIADPSPVKAADPHNL
ncbi:uncharacterized protein LOC107174404 [Citrus sinensis]|uniref:uncharacterized protein LOC107174404 n=1 Tax=Citrus sinensis TaxID=2711 RepID=UPI002278BF0E|nr:uncharacterized protein LOC107174404 [Citrus sinensis]